MNRHSAVFVVFSFNVTDEHTAIHDKNNFITSRHQLFGNYMQHAIWLAAVGVRPRSIFIVARHLTLQ